MRIKIYTGKFDERGGDLAEEGEILKHDGDRVIVKVEGRVGEFKQYSGKYHLMCWKRS